jgi:hypothetical protein
VITSKPSDRSTLDAVTTAAEGGWETVVGDEDVARGAHGQHL